jgi:hypothetical protein
VVQEGVVVGVEKVIQEVVRSDNIMHMLVHYFFLRVGALRSRPVSIKDCTNSHPARSRASVRSGPRTDMMAGTLGPFCKIVDQLMVTKCSRLEL